MQTSTDTLTPPAATRNGQPADLTAAEERVTDQRLVLGEDAWCAQVSALAEELAGRDQHAQAEAWLRTALGHYPAHISLYEQLATLAAVQGRPLEAMTLLRRAIRLAAARAGSTDALWVRLSGIALSFDVRLAREAAEQAEAHLDTVRGGDREELEARRARIELALAGVEAVEQDYQAAEQRYRRLLAQRPRLVPALQGLGQLCLQLGRVDDAIAWFERINDIDPARGFGALSQVRRTPWDDATLDRLEGLARTPGTEGSVRAGMLLQLASAWETRGDYRRAFALAEEANAASRRLLNYDPEAHRQRCARIRHAFPRALFEHRPDGGHQSRLPVFVVGMPRSGTTLIEQIIAGHSNVCGAGELGTIPRVIAGLERWERHTGSGRRYPDCVDDLDPAVIQGIAETVLRELREHAPAAGHVVDKLPHNFENIGLIKLLFPRAKIISVRRDPRDVAISNYFIDFAGKHGGMGFAYHLEWIGEQLADHNLLMHHWQQLFPGDILEVHYEDVVDDPETSARRLLDHLGVGWEPQVLDFAALQRPVKTASLWQVRQPLYATSRARWRHYQEHLQPLIAATNRKIVTDGITMVTLPRPGWLNAGVDRYRQGDLEGAERCFRALLHYLPEHAAARFMLGLVTLHRGRHDEAIALMEQALERCPWNRRWREDLARGYRLAGRDDAAAALTRAGADGSSAHTQTGIRTAPGGQLDYLFLSEETTCADFTPARSGADC